MTVIRSFLPVYRDCIADTLETAEGRRLARGLTLMLADDYDTTCSIYFDSTPTSTTGCLVSSLCVIAQPSARGPYSNVLVVFACPLVCVGAWVSHASPLAM